MCQCNLAGKDNLLYIYFDLKLKSGKMCQYTIYQVNIIFYIFISI